MTEEQTSGNLKKIWQKTAFQRLNSAVNSIAGKCLAQETAETMNQWHREQNNGEYNDPYQLGSKTFIVELQKRTAFVRAYDNEPNGSLMHGGWVMLKEDVMGLSPEQIRDKYALPCIPKYICDVYLEAGDVVCIGIAKAIDGWGDGGGIQVDLLKQRIGEFVNERRLTSVYGK